MKAIKKITTWGWVLVASAVMALIGWIIYLVSGTTGFLAGTPVNGAAVALPLVAIVLACVALILGNKVKPAKGFILVAAGVLVAITAFVIIMDRLQVFADVWFIPVNYPASEDVTVAQTIASVVFLGISTIGMIVACIKDDFMKE